MRLSFPTSMGNLENIRTPVDQTGAPVCELVPNNYLVDEILMREVTGEELCWIVQPSQVSPEYEIHYEGNIWARFGQKGVLRVKQWVDFADGGVLHLRGNVLKPDYGFFFGMEEVAHVTAKGLVERRVNVDVHDEENWAILLALAVAQDAYATRLNLRGRQIQAQDQMRQQMWQQQQQQNWNRPNF